MATYAIGDIQGCYQTLQKLLNKIQFHPDKDTLWLAGDLINRGPDSLETLKFLYQHRDSVQCVLGNHDLHFLAVESGVRKATRKDTFDPILNSNMRKKLVFWLTRQPLLHLDKSLNFAMVHAGLLAQWKLKQSLKYATEVSNYIQSSERKLFFAAMYGDQPDRWDKKLGGLERLRFITNVLTRMRYVYADGSLELDYKGEPGTQPHGLIPWFEADIKIKKTNLVFGHWASLQGKCQPSNLFALDTGCVWGGYLTALRLEDKKLFSCRSVES